METRVAPSGKTPERVGGAELNLVDFLEDLDKTFEGAEAYSDSKSGGVEEIAARATSGTVSEQMKRSWRLAIPPGRYLRQHLWTNLVKKIGNFGHIFQSSLWNTPPEE